MDFVENYDIQKLKELTNEGDLNSQYNLEINYYNGDGVEVSYKKDFS